MPASDLVLSAIQAVVAPLLPKCTVCLGAGVDEQAQWMADEIAAAAGTSAGGQTLVMPFVSLTCRRCGHAQLFGLQSVLDRARAQGAAAPAAAPAPPERPPPKAPRVAKNGIRKP